MMKNKTGLRTGVFILLALLVAGCQIIHALYNPSFGAKHGGRPAAMTMQEVSKRLAAVSRAYPNFSVAQNVALRREVRMLRLGGVGKQSLIDKLSQVTRAERWSAQTSAATVTPASSAKFVGNLTVVGNSSLVMVMQRQIDCSLTLLQGTGAASPASFQFSQVTPHYEQILHAQGGVTSTAGTFASGCSDPSLGIGSSEASYLGKTSQGLSLFAGIGVDASYNKDLFATSLSLSTTASQSGSYSSDDSIPYSVFAAADLNGDGIADLIAIDDASSSIHVLIATAAGALGTPTTYTLPGNLGDAVVAADLNGDGKIDVAVATIDTGTGQEYISILTGKGDGTLNAPQSFQVATPSAPNGIGTSAAPIQNLIAANVRGGGKLDLVGSNGVLLLNDGTAHFTTAAAAFPPTLSDGSTYAPNLAAGDFNKDGKLDLAVNDSQTIRIFQGAGDGTFTLRASYDSIADEGYITATDLDGDGNVDLWVGLERAGVFGGDSGSANIGYALMGNGDGTFRGVAELPFVYTGSNVADLDGDGIADAVGVNSDLSFTTYRGDGKGGYTAHSTLATSPVTISGQSYTLNDIESYALGDVNGDGFPDLIYQGEGFVGPTFTPGIFVALNDGHGGFAAPTFFALPNYTITHVHLADVNHDGKADLIYAYNETSSQPGTTTFGTAVQLGNGDGTFSAVHAIVYRSQSNSSSPTPNNLETSDLVAAEDLNHDGKVDLVFIAQTTTIDSTLSTYTANIEVALGNGDGTFAAPTVVTGPSIMTFPLGTVGPPSISIADMNGDGIPDIVALGSSSSYSAQIAVAIGNGDGTFKAPAVLTTTVQYLNPDQGLAVGDFDGDGKLDVLVADPYDPAGSGIFLGNGDGTLQSATNSNNAVLPNRPINLDIQGAAIALDVNGDGLADAIVGSSLLLSQKGAVTGSAATSVTLAAAPSTATAGQAVVLTATITSSTSGTPTGTVTFLDGTTSIGTGSVGAQGTATLTVSTLTAGTHSLTASYGGDTTFAADTSAATTVTVGGNTFALSLNPTSGSAAAGIAATTTVTVTPTGSASGSANLTCTGLPAGAACTFSPASVSLTGGAVTSSLSISSTARTTATAMTNGTFGPLGPAGGVLLAGLVIPATLRRRPGSSPRSQRLARLVFAFLIGGALLQGCGHDSSHGGGAHGTPAGTYTVTVTGTAGSESHTASFTLTIT